MRRVAVGLAFLMPLAFWPPSESPFSTAKEWLLGAWVLTGFVFAAASGMLRRRKLPLRVVSAVAIWIMALSLSAGLGREVSLQELIRNLLPCGSFLVLLWISPKPQKLVLALILSGTVVAAVALLQFVRLDPFLLLNLTGSLQGSSRMRIFSTLGNPNFVAAFLAAVLPLTIFFRPEGGGDLGKSRTRFLILAALLQAGAIAATGSRAPVPGFVACGAWLLLRTTRSWVRFALPVLAINAILILLSPARPLDKTIAGRFHIWKIVCDHIREIPAYGFGPGAFELHFAQWETEYLRINQPSPDRSFAGLQDHAHNDFLEFLVDYGIIGVSAFLLLVVLLVPFFHPGGTPAFESGIIASVVALLAIAVVDFPFHRPTELYLFWVLMALLWMPSGDGGTAGQAEFFKKPEFQRRSK